MAVITIEYQRGCGGRAIGQMLAVKLQWEYLDREIVRDVAQQMHINEMAAEFHDERVAGVLGRAMSLLRTTGELTWMAPDTDSQLAMTDETVYFQATSNVIEAAARRNDVVIVGHGAGFALATWPRTLRVGLYAPLEQRIATVMARRQVDHDEAQRRITTSDGDRERYIRRFYQANWHAVEQYHLMLDTSLHRPEQVADLILAAWQSSTLAARQAATSG